MLGKKDKKQRIHPEMINTVNDANARVTISGQQGRRRFILFPLTFSPGQPKWISQNEPCNCYFSGMALEKLIRA